jgi:hypothetical protein
MSSFGKNRFACKAVAGMLAVTCLLAGGILEIRAQTVARLYPVRHGQLKLQVPAGWSEEVKSATPGAAMTLAFRPAQGSRFLIRLTVSWDENAGPSYNSDERLQEIAMAAGNQFLPRSVEKQVKLEQVKGKQVRGCYFVLTDKAPRSGDYVIMAQGAAALGDALIVFTYLGYPGGEAELQSFIELLRGASLTTPLQD